MTRPIRALLIIAVAAAPIAAQQQPAPQCAVPKDPESFIVSGPGGQLENEDNDAIHGLVISLHTLQPLVGATVALPEARVYTRTDSAGRFRIAGIPHGAHELEVRVIGFKRARDTVAIAGPTTVLAGLAIQRTWDFLCVRPGSPPQVSYARIYYEPRSHLHAARGDR